MTKAREIAELGAVYDSGALSNRNKLRNGAMRISQRGNATGVTTSSFGGPDGWKVWTNMGTLDLNQSTDAPDGFSNSLEIDITTAGTVASSTYMQTAIKIEAQDVQDFSYGTSAAKQVTLSFWVKSNKAGTYQVNFRLDDTAKMASKAYTINSADTWEYKSVTVAGSTADVIPNDTGNGFMLDFWLASGSNYNSGTTSDNYITISSPNYNAASTVNIGTSTSDYWRITGVQLEVGPEATPFEHRSYGDELARCQRYYYAHITAPTSEEGICTSSNWNSLKAYGTINFPVEMRASPTLNARSASAIWKIYHNNTAATFDTLAITNTSKVGTMIFNSDNVGVTQGSGSNIQSSINSANYVHFDAEL